MYERLIEAQNEDGSWGEDIANHRAHATFVVVAALVDLPPVLRPNPPLDTVGGIGPEASEPAGAGSP